jgi:hypothetical protein
MTKIELIKHAVERGITYNSITGEIFGISGRKIKRKSHGYIDIALIVEGKNRHLPGHQFAFYTHHGYLPNCIDHIDRNRENNKIDNLREASHNENTKNTLGRGYYLHSQTGKYCAQVTHNYKHLSLGCYDTEQEARQAYLDYKSNNHLPES